MKFTGKIVSDDGSEITGINGDLQFHTSATGMKSWDGYFPMPRGKFIGVGTHQLILDDGRSGQIIIDRVSSGSHQSTVARFNGSGPLQ
jgi:hypothetical protein